MPLGYLAALCALCCIAATAVFVIWRRRARYGPPDAGLAWPSPKDMVEEAAAVRARFRQISVRRSANLGDHSQKQLIRLMYEMDTYKSMYWLGIPVLKCPSDMWMMQQIITETRPDFIVETGTYYGGSALYYAHVLEGLGLSTATVITIDRTDRTHDASKISLWNDRVRFLRGNSIDDRVISAVASSVSGSVMVVLDSDHSRRHVRAELEKYAQFVTVDSYLVVEDTAFDAVPLRQNRHNGAAAAVREFLDTEMGAKFAPDLAREIFVTTFHPGGWLRRIENTSV